MTFRLSRLGLPGSVSLLLKLGGRSPARGGGHNAGMRRRRVNARRLSVGRRRLKLWSHSTVEVGIAGWQCWMLRRLSCKR